MWESIVATVREELSDLSSASDVTRVSLRLLIAAILGGILGYERESARKAAGLRTHMLVAIGSAIFVLVPQQAGASSNDMTRVLQGLVAGVGFLGAGSIIHNSSRRAAEKPHASQKNEKDDDNFADKPEDGEVKGLTTAAAIWLTAAIGMAAGMGREVTAVLSTVLALVVLSVVPKSLSWLSAPKKN